MVLFEKSERLGGQVKLVMKTPMRHSFEEIIKFGEKQLPKLGGRGEAGRGGRRG